MSDNNTGLENAPGGAPAPQRPTNPAANIDGQKLLGLLKNPTASVKLQPATDWIYGVIGAAIGVIGFWFFVWALHEETTPDFGDDFAGALGALASLGRAFDSPFWSLYGAMGAGKYLILGVCAIVLAAVAFTLVGNWIGGRKRTWQEAATYYGGTQLQTGAGLIIAGILTFISAELGALVATLFLLLSLVVLVIQGLALHEVSRERVFPYIYQSVGGFGVAVYIVYLLFT
ncbi:hypothetical protein [Cohnella panacarvi]|uniref:hypothetical protein n=1 Tax=Cohnella panacarvi TaxID=400776 RepID=UPI00047AC928|nr:hypothetical protein [Cohnella panacarvi]